MFKLFNLSDSATIHLVETITFTCFKYSTYQIVLPYMYLENSVHMFEEFNSSDSVTIHLEETITYTCLKFSFHQILF